MHCQPDPICASPVRLEYSALHPHLPARRATEEERLPFTIRLVQNHDGLRNLLPGHPQDTAQQSALRNGVVFLLAESKFDQSPLGSLRIETNWFNPLRLEQSIALPEWLQSRPLAEATDLGVTQQRSGRNVKTLLFKAYYQYCLQNGIEWMVIAGRSPIGREYDRLLSFDVGTARERWTKAGHPLTRFMFDTEHPDIHIESQLQGQFQ